MMTMSDNTPEPIIDIDAWDDEIFAEFVSGAGSSDELADDDASVVQVDAVKEMLASLETKDACTADVTPKTAQRKKRKVRKGVAKNQRTHKYDSTPESESSDVEQKRRSWKAD